MKNSTEEYDKKFDEWLRKVQENVLQNNKQDLSLFLTTIEEDGHDPFGYFDEGMTAEEFAKIITDSY